MILIFGGAYQGKVDYVKENYNVAEDDIFRCKTNGVLDYNKKVICQLENYIRFCTENGIEAKESIDIKRLQNSIVICEDTSQGLVPMDPEDRAYREMAGRTLLFLGKEATQVTRVFCGLGHRLK